MHPKDIYLFEKYLNNCKNYVNIESDIDDDDDRPKGFMCRIKNRIFSNEMQNDVDCCNQYVLVNIIGYANWNSMKQCYFNATVRLLKDFKCNVNQEVVNNTVLTETFTTRLDFNGVIINIDQK